MQLIVQNSLLAISGVSLYVAFQHLYWGLKARKTSFQLILSALSVILSGYATAQCTGLRATSVSEYVTSLRWAITYSTLFQLLLIWFIASYCHTRAFKFPTLQTVIGLAFIQLNFLTPFTLQYESISKIHRDSFPWGEELSSASGTNSLVFLIINGWTASNFFYCLYLLYQPLRRQRNWTSLFSFIAVSASYTACFQSGVVRWGYVDSIPTDGYGFFLIVIVMSGILLLDASHRSERLKHIIDHVPAVVYMKDLEGKFLLMNRHYEDQFQIPRGKGIGLTDFDFFPPPQCELFRSNDIHVATSRETLETIEIANRNGEPRHYISLKFPVMDSGGQVTAIAGVSTDITERIIAQQTLEESEKRFRLMADSAPVMIWQSEIDTLCSYFNKTWLDFTGRSIQLELGNGWVDNVHPDDLPHCMQTYHVAFGARLPFRMEYRLRRFDGEFRWLLDTGTPRFDSELRFLGYIGSCIDITERKEMEIALVRQAGQLNSVFAMSPDGFVASDSEDVIILINPSFCHITGFKSEDLLGKPLHYLEKQFAEIIEENRLFNGFAEFIANSESAGDMLLNRWTLNRSHRKVVDIVGRRSGNPDRGLMLFFRDMTHEVEIDRMKSEFLAVAAHELRTPITSILGFSELLLSQTYEESERIDLLTIISDQSQRISQILDELLDLARIEARKGLDFEIEDVDICVLLQELVTEESNNSAKWPIDVFSPGLVVVRCDRKKTYQAISNVLSNAIKYSPGGGKIRVSFQFPTPEVAQIGVSVSDQGIGMNEDQVSRIFQRFYRAEQSGAIKGTGLGMSIVKEIMEIQGGSVQVASALGQGTTVTLWFNAGIAAVGSVDVATS